MFLPTIEQASKIIASLSNSIVSGEGPAQRCFFPQGKGAVKSTKAIDGHNVATHTLAWVAAGHGALPEGKDGVSPCPISKGCINPAHLRPTSTFERARERVAAGKGRKNRIGGKCVKGHHDLKSEQDLRTSWRMTGYGYPIPTRECRWCALDRKNSGSEFSELYAPAEEQAHAILVDAGFKEDIAASLFDADRAQEIADEAACATLAEVTALRTEAIEKGLGDYRVKWCHPDPSVLEDTASVRFILTFWEAWARCAERNAAMTWSEEA